MRAAGKRSIATCASIAKRQRALDAEEAALLCIAARSRIWEQLGKASLLEYLEDIFGYSPKVAHERVRVALALEEMPDLLEALERGEVSYSALREVTRVATAETQREWLDSIRGKNLRQIEELARSRKKGAKPTDPADPNLKPRMRSFEITPATDALLRQARQALAGERGHFIEDDEFLAAMATALLEGGADSSAKAGAKFQIRVTVCENCEQAWQEGAGRKIAISAADAARAECDAQRIGDDGRAKQDITPAVRRLVWHRDGGKCAVPGCRSSLHLDVHHIVWRIDGGNHEAGNLTLLCDGHHRALHNGKLVITGIAPKLVCRFVDDPIPHVETASWIADSIPHEVPNTSAPAPIPHASDVTPRLADPTPNFFATTADSIPHVETARFTDRFLTWGFRIFATTADSIPHVETARFTDPIPHVGIPNTFAKIADSIPHVETARFTDPIPHVGIPNTFAVTPNKFASAVMTAQAKQVLRTAGFRAGDAKRFVESALAEENVPRTLETLIVAALKYSR